MKDNGISILFFICFTDGYFIIELHFKFHIQNVQRHKHSSVCSEGNLNFYLITGLKFRIPITLDIFTSEAPTLNSNLLCFRITPVGNQ